MWLRGRERVRFNEPKSHQSNSPKEPAARCEDGSHVPTNTVEQSRVCACALPHRNCSGSQPFYTWGPTAPLSHIQNQSEAATQGDNMWSRPNYTQPDLQSTEIHTGCHWPTRVYVVYWPVWKAWIRSRRIHTLPSSIGLSLMWTTGPGWDLVDLE